MLSAPALLLILASAAQTGGDRPPPEALVPGPDDLPAIEEDVGVDGGVLEVQYDESLSLLDGGPLPGEPDEGALDDEEGDGGPFDGGALDGGADPECPPGHPRCSIHSLTLRIVRGAPFEELKVRTVLEDLRGRPATQEVAAEAARRLSRIKRYAGVTCRIGEGRERGSLICGLFRKRTIRDVSIEGLPIRLLETDLRKRIFLRTGEALPPPGSKGYDRIAQQRERILEYLERQGYYGAEVRILAPKTSEESQVDITIQILGGEFIRVRDVEVKDTGPLLEVELEGVFSGMCLAPGGFLDLYETFTFACLTREQLQATRERLEGRLRRLGHPEGRVRVVEEVVDPVETDDRSCGWSKDEIESFQSRSVPVPPRCVDLTVDVIEGPHLSVDLVFPPGTAEEDFAEIPIVGEWLQPAVDLVYTVVRGFRRSITEPISRALQVGFQGEIEDARDSDIFISDLREVFSFDKTHSADRVEAERTRRALQERLAQRGHFNAQVSMRYEVLEDGDEIQVTYDAVPGAVSAVTEIRFEGLEAFDEQEFLAEVSLEATPRPQGGIFGAGSGLSRSGFVSPRQLDADAERIMAFYESRGYLEVNVTWEGYREPGGAMVVRFLIDEGPVFKVAEVQLVGGVPELIMPVLAAISVCRTGLAGQQGRPPIAPQDCQGSAFLMDELETDARRILNIYVANGYPYSDAEVEVVGFTDAGAVVAVRIWSNKGEVKKPQPVKLGQVFIDGNEDTDPDVMLREMNIDSRRLRPVQIAEGLTRLRRTGLFRRVSVDYIGIEERTDQVHLRLHVEERPSITWDGSVGFSTDRLFSVRNEIRNRNFLGRMLELRGMADVGLFIGRRSHAEVSLRWPRFLGLPVGFKLTGPGVIYDDRPSVFVPRAPVTQGPGPAVASWLASDVRRRNLKLFTTFSVDYKPWTDIDLVVGHDYEFRLEWDDPTAHPIEPLSFESLRTVDGVVNVVTEKTVQPISTFQPWLTYRNIDNPFDPSEGGTADLSLRVGSPWLANQEWLALLQAGGTYYASWWRFTLAVRGRGWAGYAFGEPGRRSTLLQQNLVALGGDRSVRGFPRDRIGVPGLPVRASEGQDVTHDGHLGLLGFNGNVELRVLAFRELAIGDLKLAIFSDVGMVTDTDPDLFFSLTPAPEDLLSPSRSDVDTEAIANAFFAREQPRAGISIGAGVRYVLPVGPLSLDVACSVLDRPAAERCGWHLQLGYAS